MKPLVAIDCDGVLSDLTGELCAALRRRGFKRWPAEIKHWDLNLSLSAIEADEVPTIFSTPGFVGSMLWLPGAKGIVRLLREAGADVVCLTAPYPSRTWMRERVEWLADLFKAKDVVFASSERKRHFRADVLIEDHPGTAVSWLNAHPEGHAVLIDATWNQAGAKEWAVHPRMFRADHFGAASVAKRYLPRKAA